MHQPFCKYWDQHYMLRVTGLSQRDLYMRPDVELSADPTEVNYYKLH